MTATPTDDLPADPESMTGRERFCDKCAGPYPLDSYPGNTYGGHWDTCPNATTVDDRRRTADEAHLADLLDALLDGDAGHDVGAGLAQAIIAAGYRRMDA